MSAHATGLFDPLTLPLPPQWLTPRLVLRCPTPADIPEVNAAVSESLPRLKPWMPWAQEPPTAARADVEFRRMQAAFLQREELAMFMFERSAGHTQGRFVGGCGLHRIDWTLRRFEIGYWRRTTAANGLIDEAVQALTRLAFDGFDALRVEIRMDERNLASRRVAERNGYTLEGVLRADSTTPTGQPRDTRLYARVRGVEEPARGAV
jgi:RimJ/RimL family protein N-acetyltransferase